MQYRMEEQPVDSRFLLGLLLDTGAAAENFSHLARCFQGHRAEELCRMTREVRAHNNFAQRMPVVEEQIKGIQHRLSDLEGFHRPMN